MPEHILTPNTKKIISNVVFAISWVYHGDFRMMIKDVAITMWLVNNGQNTIVPPSTNLNTLYGWRCLNFFPIRVAVHPLIFLVDLPLNTSLHILTVFVWNEENVKDRFMARFRAPYLLAPKFQPIKLRPTAISDQLQKCKNDTNLVRQFLIFLCCQRYSPSKNCKKELINQFMALF